MVPLYISLCGLWLYGQKHVNVEHCTHVTVDHLIPKTWLHSSIKPSFFWEYFPPDIATVQLQKHFWAQSQPGLAHTLLCSSCQRCISWGPHMDLAFFAQGRGERNSWHGRLMKETVLTHNQGSSPNSAYNDCQKLINSVTFSSPLCLQSVCFCDPLFCWSVMSPNLISYNERPHWMPGLYCTILIDIYMAFAVSEISDAIKYAGGTVYLIYLVHTRQVRPDLVVNATFKLLLLH